MSAADELLGRVPDEPRWIEARALALALAAGAPGVDAVRCASGWLVRAPADGLAVAIGVAPASALAAVTATAAATPMALLLPELGTTTAEAAEVTAAAVAAGRRAECAVIHTLAGADDDAALPDDDGAELLPAEAALAHVPAPLRAELVAARARGPVVAAHVDGVAVSFAYAPWRSERWFDVSVDTLPGLRQRGLATRVAAGLIRLERAAVPAGGARRQPVWGADEDNAASRALAARLGFVEVDRLWLVP